MNVYVELVKAWREYSVGSVLEVSSDGAKKLISAGYAKRTTVLGQRKSAKPFEDNEIAHVVAEIAPHPGAPSNNPDGYAVAD